MSIEPRFITNQPPVVEAVLSGVLDRDDYEKLRSYLSSLNKELGSISLLLRLENFQNIGGGALREYFESGTKPFSTLNRLAIVGDEQDQESAEQITQLFSNSTIQIFSLKQMDEAEQWVKGGVENMPTTA